MHSFKNSLEDLENNSVCNSVYDVFFIQILFGMRDGCSGMFTCVVMLSTVAEIFFLL